MPLHFNFELLIRTRLDLNLTQEQAASAIGVDVRTYRRYESGEVNEPNEGFSIRHASRRRIVQRIGEEFGVGEHELLVNQATEVAALPSSGAWSPRFAHALSRARHFVGRVEVLAELETFLGQRSPARVFAVIGLGGSGKSSLVEHAVAKLVGETQPFGVFVYSFYEDERVESFFEQAFTYFARGATRGSADLPSALGSLLSGSGLAHLLVLDGIELLQRDGRVQDASLRRLLRSVASGLGSARLIVTSRFELTDLREWEGVGFTTRKLGALAEAEARSLLEHWGLAVDPAELSDLMGRIGGHALSVAMFGSYAGMFLQRPQVAGSVKGELTRLLGSSELESAARDEPHARRLRSVLSAYADALEPLERDVLSRLCVFPAGADLALLENIGRAEVPLAGALAGRSRSELLRSLGRLERMGLVQLQDASDSYVAHPVVCEHFQAFLGVPSEAVHALEAKRLAASLEHHAPAPLDSALANSYETLLLHTLASGRAEEAAQIYLRRLGGFPELGLRRGEMSRGLRVMQRFADDGAPEQVRSDLSAIRRARLSYDWGLYASALGDLGVATRCYLGYIEIANSVGNLEAAATGLRTLGYTRRLAGDLDEALKLLDSSLLLAERAESPAELVRGISLRARVLHDLGRHDEAGREFERARALGDQPFARRALWEAEHFLEVGEVERANTRLQAILGELDEVSWQGHLAHTRCLKGFVELARPQPNLEAARAHLQAARSWVALSGEVEMILRCFELDARIAHAASHVAASRDTAKRGQELARACGFDWFTPRFERCLS